LVERGALTSLWVVDGQKNARLRLVKIGRSLGDRVEVLAGLDAGEKVAVSGLEKLSDGVKVE
jgi:multidrug efflux pump subunit AcrA (membrane-fusion protein)